MKITLFKEFMATMAAIHEKPLTDILTDIYWAVLKDYEAEDLRRGFTRAVRELKFFPKPAELVEIIEGAVSDRALVAFGKLKLAIEDLGHGRSVAFDDPVIHSVVEELGGWLTVCKWERDELPFRQRDFERWYRVHQRHDEHPAYLVGAYEAENRVWQGDPLRARIVAENAAVRYIGNRERARELCESAKARRIASPQGALKALVGSVAEGMKA